eukprot:5447725-Prymnesium_polylepis.2
MCFGCAYRIERRFPCHRDAIAYDENKNDGVKVSPFHQADGERSRLVINAHASKGPTLKNTPAVALHR